jgi:DNA topoisomerase VI subunit B
MRPAAALPLLHCPCLQPGKCLYTTIRELVENALDSAESIGNLPLVEISV